MRAAILERCRANLAELQRAAAAVPEVSARLPGGGWSAALRVPAVVGEEELTLELLEKDGVAVHPGYFFDFPGAGTLVLSLLPEPATFSEGVRRLLARLRTHLQR